MKMAQTKLANLVNPEVMAQMVSANLPKKIKFSRIAHIDTTLVGRSGDTVTVPKYAYIGDAEDVAEGVAMGTTTLTASTTTVTIKKAGKAIELTDESVLSGYGDPVGEGTNQITMAIASKIDADCVDALDDASMVYDGSAGIIDYEGIVKAVDLMEDESDEPIQMIMFVHPKQVTQLRLDPEFRDITKYPLQTVMTGTIGAIAGVQIVKSKRVKVVEVGEEGSQVECYANPIIVVDQADPNQAPDADGNAESATALTIYMKRDVQLEADRDILAKTTVVSGDEHYGVALSNDSKVVMAKFAVEAPATA